MPAYGISGPAPSRGERWTEVELDAAFSQRRDRIASERTIQRERIADALATGRSVVEVITPTRSVPWSLGKVPGWDASQMAAHLELRSYGFGFDLIIED